MQVWISRLEAVNVAVGATVRWLALTMVLLQFAIVVLRYVFGISYIFLDESVLYMHATLFMLGAGYTLLADAHVRVDIFYGRFATRGRAAIALAGAERRGGGWGKRGSVGGDSGGSRNLKK